MKRSVAMIMVFTLLMGLLSTGAFAATDDTTAPLVKSVTRTDNLGERVTVGDTLYFDVEVEDASAIRAVSIAFEHPTADTFNTQYARMVTYNESTKTASLRLRITEAIPCTRWSLDHIIPEDYYGNSDVVYAHDLSDVDVDALSFVVTATGEDTFAPKVTNLKRVDDLGDCVTVGDTLYFDVEVEDASAIRAVSLAFEHPNADTFNTQYARMVSYNGDTKTARLRLRITEAIPSTRWSLDHIIPEDYYGNSDVVYVHDLSNIDVDALSFVVAGTKEDTTAPRILSLKRVDCMGAKVTSGDALYFDVEVEDASAIRAVSIAFEHPNADTFNTQYARMVTYNGDTKTARLRLRITETIPCTRWSLDHIIPEDYYGNSDVIYACELAAAGLEDVSFTVTGTDAVDDDTHTPGMVIRKNEVPATCKEAGAYDEVVYCSVCETELSRMAKAIAKLTTHTPGDWVIDKEPTTSKPGSRHKECGVCGLVLETAEISVLPNKPSESAEPNETPKPELPNNLQNYFLDISEKDYFFEAVQWAYENGITGGTGNGKFAPNASCTRAQVVTFLWRAMGQPIPEGNSSRFSDVQTNCYYSLAVQWAMENGITAGTSNNTFGPNANVTREQFVTFLWRAMGEPTSYGKLDMTDVSADQYYYDAVRWAVENGVTQGISANTFGSTQGCTRGQVVTFLYRNFGD